MKLELNNYKKLKLSSGHYIAYNELNFKKNHNKNKIIFMHGLHSDRCGSKSQALYQYCFENQYDYICFDTRGHGKSTGDFDEMTMSDWLEDAKLVLEQLGGENNILVGSSVGGWLMLLLALAKPSRVKALIGIAVAPDCTDELIWKKLDDSKKTDMIESGFMNIEGDCGEISRISYKLVEDGKKHLLLGEKIEINCPVILLHGTEDAEVPYQTSLQLAQDLQSDDVTIILNKDSGHRMSGQKDLEKLYYAVETMLKK